MKKYKVDVSPVMSQSKENVMTKEDAVKNYLCSGCVSGEYPSCYAYNKSNDFSCVNHCAGTRLLNVGKILLGFPKGFNRLGACEETQINIFENIENGWGYDKYNIPVWKHLDVYENTIVRGISPRTNFPFIHVFLENCIEKINCIEITKEECDEMD